MSKHNTSRFKIHLPVLAIVKQVDEGFRVAGSRSVVHGAQALIVPQGGVGLVLKVRDCTVRATDYCF